MGLPFKLKNFMLFKDGNNFQGEIESVTLPKLTRKVEEWRGGGMNGPIEVDLGHEKLEMTFNAGGLLKVGIAAFGATTHNANQWRWMGAYDDESGTIMAVEVHVSGRLRELDMGEAQAGEETSHTHAISVSYYKLVIDGVDTIEIDVPGMVFKVEGVDLYAQVRRAIGLS